MRIASLITFVLGTVSATIAINDQKIEQTLPIIEQHAMEIAQS